MGAGTGGYVQITLQTLLSYYEQKTGQLHRISELSFTSAPVPGSEHDPPNPAGKVDPSLKPGDPPAAKLGLGGVDPDDVITFNLFARLDDGSLADMGVARRDSISKELHGAFGGDWAGFAVTLAPTGGRFKLVADVTLRPRFKQKAKRPFQVIPVVIAFGTDNFVDHYLLAVIAAQNTEEKVDTSVTQPYQ
jgi:hypothetical protein